MTENTHTFVMPGGSNYTFKMLWQYDSWNRIKLITYPDGEKVTYTYKKYGQLSTVTSLKNTSHPTVTMSNGKYKQLSTVTSLKNTSSTTLITSVFFDKFGNRLKINYGNGTYCNYTYDPVTLRLSTLKSYDKNSKPMQTLAYTYDNVGNITAINNTAVTMPNGMGGPYNYNYTYDDLYRLQSAWGSWKTTAANFNLQKMSYSPSGNILQKVITANTSINGVNINIDKDYSYSYNSAKPHAVSNVFSFAYGYDANGNMTSDCPTRTCRIQAWDEENRLTTVNDKNKSYLSNYLYDAGGERIIKLSGAIQKITQQNGDIIEFANLGENISINFGAHMVLNNNRYTKHYYIEGQRICSKLGKGFSAPPVGITQSVTPISGTYTNIANKVLVMFHRGDYKTGFDTLNTTYPASITIVPNSTAAETDRYFYHSDLPIAIGIGSSSFISSNAGTTTQHLQYLPPDSYRDGESFVEQKISTAYLTPSRFSGKEKDEETGYSYFGARYYNPELSIWLSVDPLATKYPSMSPYAYCANNPVMLVDPDGRDIDISKLTNSGHLSGFSKFMTTAEGKIFISQYVKAGTYEWGGVKYTFTSDGSRSKDILSIETASEQGTVNMTAGAALGMTESFVKKSSTSLQNANNNVDISGGIFERISLNGDMGSADESAAVIGHEAFIHAQKDADRLNIIDSKMQNVGYKNSNTYKQDINLVGNSGKKDHINFNKNGNKDYYNYMIKLNKGIKDNYFINFYNNDKENCPNY